MSFALHFLLVFLALTLTDVLWGIYIKAVGNDKAWRAGLVSGLLMIFGAFSVISYMGDHRLLVAAVMGCFSGTVIGVKIHKKKK